MARRLRSRNGPVRTVSGRPEPFAVRSKAPGRRHWWTGYASSRTPVPDRARRDARPQRRMVTVGIVDVRGQNLIRAHALTRSEMASVRFSSSSDNPVSANPRYVMAAAGSPRTSAASPSSARRVAAFVAGSRSGGHIPPSVATATSTAEPASRRCMIETAQPSVSSSGCGASTRQDSRPTLDETSALIAQSERPTSFASGAFAGSMALSRDCREIHDIATTLTRSHHSQSCPAVDASSGPEETASATASATAPVEAAGHFDAGSRTSADTARPDPSTMSTADSTRSAASSAPT